MRCSSWPDSFHSRLWPSSIRTASFNSANTHSQSIFPHSLLNPLITSTAMPLSRMTPARADRSRTRTRTRTRTLYPHPRRPTRLSLPHSSALSPNSANKSEALTPFPSPASSHSFHSFLTLFPLSSFFATLTKTTGYPHSLATKKALYCLSPPVLRTDFLPTLPHWTVPIRSRSATLHLSHTKQGADPCST